MTDAPSEPGPISLEMMLTHPDAFGLTTATPVQRAICRAADGEALGELWKSTKVRRSFGGARPRLSAPSMMLILAGIRGAKSMTAAAKAICATQNVDVSQCKPGDDIRLPVLSTEVDTAQAIFQHIKGALLASPMLKSLLVGEPKADSVKVRHPSGVAIEIKVTAMARAGTTLVGRWLAGCIFDEAPRMMGDDSVKSLSESLRAIRGRILPGGQIWLIGSPWAPFGPVYDIFSQHFGKPGPTLVIKARAPDLNPVWWTKERIAEVKANDPKAYRTDVLAEFADPEESLIGSVDLAAITREDMLLPRRPGVSYVAAMDPATRGNAWTLAILGHTGDDDHGDPHYELAYVEQWVGSTGSPLSPALALASVSAACADYGIDEVLTDQYSIDALKDLGQRFGLSVLGHTVDSANRLKWAENLAFLVAARRITVPKHTQLRTDLLAAKKRVTQNGHTLVLPATGDGRHCDFFPALSLALAFPPENQPPPDAEEDDEARFIRELTEQNEWATAASVLT